MVTYVLIVTESDKNGEEILVIKNIPEIENLKDHALYEAWFKKRKTKFFITDKTELPVEKKFLPLNPTKVSEKDFELLEPLFSRFHPNPDQDVESLRKENRELKKELAELKELLSKKK